MTTVNTDDLSRKDLHRLEYNFKDRYFASIPNNVYEFVGYNSEIKFAEIDKMLDKEVKAKYIDLVHRITAVVGEIQDVSNLSIGSQSGEINGLVVGSKGKAKVETISAGGYNIQIFHFRVLVHKIKD